MPATMSLGDVALQANGTIGTGAADYINGGFGTISVDSSGGSISADSLTAQANGSTFGGLISLSADNYGGPGSLQFGSVDAHTTGSDWGGSIIVETSSGATIDLGEATLDASGAFGGYIGLLAGYCDCGDGEHAMALNSAALPQGGGIAATDLTLRTSGNIIAELSGGADISASGTLQGNAGQYIDLLDDGSGGAIRGHAIDLSALTIQGNAHLIADTVQLTTNGDLSIGDVDASNSATFTAGSLAQFTGTVSSPTITVTSGDIDIADGASLGVWGVTNLLTLNAESAGLPILIGDNGESGAEGQYVLNEDGNIRTAAIVINALGGSESAPPDVQVFDVHIEGSGSTGDGGRVGHVTLNTGGTVFVNGLVDFTDAGASDSLTINGGHAIEVNTDTGGIQITDSAGALAGTLTLNADNVWVGAGSLLTQLETDPNFSGRDAALGTNSGTPNQDGFVRAGTIVAGVTDTFLVQNSGTPDLFGGIDTGDGGLSIGTTGATPAVIIAYGRQTNSNGQVITNEDFLDSVDVTGTGYTDDSAVNGCHIGGACGETFTIDMSSILGPLDEASGDDKKKDKDKDQDDNGDGSNADPSLRLINTTPINLDHQIDDPVTSGGDVVIGAN
jgi:hypothetical protein